MIAALTETESRVSHLFFIGHMDTVKIAGRLKCTEAEADRVLTQVLDHRHSIAVAIRK